MNCQDRKTQRRDGACRACPIIIYVIPLKMCSLHFGLPAARRCGSIRIKSSTVQIENAQEKSRFPWKMHNRFGCHSRFLDEILHLFTLSHATEAAFSLSRSCQDSKSAGDVMGHKCAGLFPTLTCAVSAPSFLPPVLPHPLTHTSHTSHTHIPHTTHTNTHHPHTHTSLTHTHTSLTHTQHSHTHISLTHTHHSHSLTHTQMYARVSLQCPLVSAALPVAFAWQARDLVHCKGSDVRPGIPPVFLGLRRSAGVAGAGLGALQRGQMYALASLRCPFVSAASHLTHTYITHHHSHSLRCTPRCPLVSAALPVAFAWQARDLVHCKGVGCTPCRWLVRGTCDLVHCKGVGCTPWRPSGVPWSPPLCRWLLRGRRGTWCTAKGSWQARDLVHCKGVGCTPWRPSGVPWSPPLCRWLLRGRRGT